MAGELILVVDDDPPSRRVLLDFLELKGYRVVCAATGEEAIEVSRRNRPALVLMDIRMPGMGGIAAAHALREDPRLAGLAVMAVTASCTQEELERYAAARFDAVHLKPLDLPAVARSIDRLLGNTS